MTLNFGPNANTAAVSSFTISTLKEVLNEVGEVHATITSTARNAHDQARAMFQALEKEGASYWKKIYKAPGRRVIDVYSKGKDNGDDAGTIQQSMEDKINSEGPGNVSRHCADFNVLNVVDIAISSLSNSDAVQEKLKGDSRISKVIVEKRALHIEVPQSGGSGSSDSSQSSSSDSASSDSSSQPSSDSSSQSSSDSSDASSAGASSGSGSNVNITFGPNADKSTVSDGTLALIKEILGNAGESGATITSTARNAHDQARAMYQSLEKDGADYWKGIYKSPGKKVIDVYTQGKDNGDDADTIRQAMEDKINELGPGNVSRHCADSSKLNVFDIACSSLNDSDGVQAKLKADSRVSKVIVEKRALHVEVPQDGLSQEAGNSEGSEKESSEESEKQTAKIKVFRGRHGEKKPWGTELKLERPESGEEEEKIELEWEVEDATTVTLNGEFVDPSGSRQIDPPTQDTEYQLMASGADNVMKTESVKVEAYDKVELEYPIEIGKKFGFDVPEGEGNYFKLGMVEVKLEFSATVSTGGAITFESGYDDSEPKESYWKRCLKEFEKQGRGLYTDLKWGDPVIKPIGADGEVEDGKLGWEKKLGIVVEFNVGPATGELQVVIVSFGKDKEGKKEKPKFFNAELALKKEFSFAEFELAPHVKVSPVTVTFEASGEVEPNWKEIGKYIAEKIGMDVAEDAAVDAAVAVGADAALTIATVALPVAIVAGSFYVLFKAWQKYEVEHKLLATENGSVAGFMDGVAGNDKVSKKYRAIFDAFDEDAYQHGLSTGLSQRKNLIDQNCGGDQSKLDDWLADNGDDLEHHMRQDFDNNSRVEAFKAHAKTDDSLSTVNGWWRATMSGPPKAIGQMALWEQYRGKYPDGFFDTDNDRAIWAGDAW